MELFAVFLIGLFGSLHCIGMCGPIALALPMPVDLSKFYISRILYNCGRVISYALLGALFGMIGKSFSLFGFQQWMSIVFGAVLIISVILPLKYRSAIGSLPFLGRLLEPLKNKINYQFQRKDLASFFIIGILNGFLPCGFVYVGIAAAIVSGDILTGIISMVLFGLGTIPVMFFVSLFGKTISLDLRARLRKIVPVLAVLLGIIFILRGMNLGIKYISPKQPVQVTQSSHH